MHLDYNPPATLKDFLLADGAVNLVRGPVGSAKSTACIMRLLMEAMRVPPCASDGVRRSKMVISRATLQQLKTTCLVSIRQLLQPIMHWRVSDATIQIRFNDVESDWILLPLDTPENIERLLSLELTWGWVSEFREISPDIVNGVYSRCGRFPSRAMLAEEHHNYGYGVVAETNSFSEDSPWYNQLEVELPANWRYFVQPGAFDEGAENRENLPPRYYEELLESNSPEWCEQYVHNKITPSLSGQAVHRSTFDVANHVSQSPLHPTPDAPLIIGMDTGRHPACIIAQMTRSGQLRVLGETYAAGQGCDVHLQEHLMPLLNNDPRYAGMACYLILDPQCTTRGEIGDEHVLAMCRRLGFAALPASTYRLEPRLRAVDKFLTQFIHGVPGMLIDGVHCPSLVLAMSSRYRFKIKKKSGEMDETPEKNHPWSDLCDALQYVCLGTGEKVQGRVMRMLDRETVASSRRKTPSVGGWT